MSIWFHKNFSIEDVKALGKGTMTEHLGFEWVATGDNWLKAKMPVDHRTNQPYGFLHGGASCVLAETLGSVGSAMVIDHSKFYCVGIEINANHIRSVTGGFVYGKCTPLHLGGTIHVWEMRITDESDNLICISRLTVAIRKRKDQAN
jgi:1,4-dihydroxy-2-naphthoyl-CoA hydrolase